MPKRTSIASIPAIDLAYAVHRLIATGNTTAPEVLRLAAERVQRIAALEAELKVLTGRGGVASAPAARPTTTRKKSTARKAPAPKPTKPTRRKLRETPQRRAQRKIHGTYIGLLRGLPKAEKAKMKALAAKNGMAAAVEVMRNGKARQRQQG
jgi:hypothetical protein